MKYNKKWIQTSIAQYSARFSSSQCCLVQDNRWTIRTTEWQVRKGRRPRGRPKMRWKDDIMKWQGATWTRTAKDRKEVERTYGGLLPAVEGHSLGTRYKVQCCLVRGVSYTHVTYQYNLLQFYWKESIDGHQRKSCFLIQSSQPNWNTAGKKKKKFTASQ